MFNWKPPAFTSHYSLFTVFYLSVMLSSMRQRICKKKRKVWRNSSLVSLGKRKVVSSPTFLFIFLISKMNVYCTLNFALCSKLGSKKEKERKFIFRPWWVKVPWAKRQWILHRAQE